MSSEYQFVNNDTAALQADMIALYEQMTGLTVHPASPEKLFIAWVSAALVQAYAMMNYVGNQNIPSRANGENLDALGELFYAIERPEATSAICTEQFTISEAQNFDIAIPAGTRVTDASRSLFWETTAEAVIPAGQTTAAVTVRCQTAGVGGNGYVAGQLNTIVDVFQYYSSCTNLTTSDGGSDAATDEEYYALLKASQDAYSTAGPIGAYAYHARRVSTEISDVKVVRPRMVIDKELPVYSHHAFLSADGLHLDTLEVNAGSPNIDYTVSEEDGLVTITLLETGSFYDNDTISIRGIADYAGCIDIYALMSDGSAASATIKDLILAACNDETVRPLTDKVSVKDPESVSYNINVTYYTSDDNTASSTEVSAAVNAAIDEFKAWQAARIGRDINPSKLIQYIMGTGVVKRVNVIAPVFTSLRDGSDHNTPQLAVIGTTTVTNGGVEDD